MQVARNGSDRKVPVVQTPALRIHRWVETNRNFTAAGAVITALLGWMLWPSQYSRVSNLASRGSSIVAFGDSLTAGYGAGPGEDYPTRLAVLTGVTVLNAGGSGDTTEAALARLDADVLAHDPRIVIVGLGGNDFLRGIPVASTENNLRTVVRNTQKAGAMIVLLGFRFPSLNANYEAMYVRVAHDERCLLIPDLLRGIINNPSLKSDEIHPNARGYQLMADRISGPLARLISKADASR